MNGVAYVPIGGTINFLFPTFRSDTGAAGTFSGSPTFAIFRSNSDTPKTVGIDLTPGYGGITGFNQLAIDTSDDDFYDPDAADVTYTIVVTAGTTADGVPLIGYIVSKFASMSAAYELSATGKLAVVTGVADAVEARLLGRHLSLESGFDPLTKTLSILWGDDYRAAESRAINLSKSTWPDLTNADEIKLRVKRCDDDETVEPLIELDVAATDLRTIQGEIPGAWRATLRPALEYKYSIRAKFATDKQVTLALGLLNVGDSV